MGGKGHGGAGERLLRLVPAFRRSLDQVTTHRAEWARRNASALATRESAPDSPLWVVLGDSTAQGVGVPDLGDGYVLRVRALLESADETRWQVLNLSRSSAVIRDVLDEQLPAMRELDPAPDLVTAVVGGNDLRRTPLDRLLADVAELVAGLPAGAVVATMPRGLREAKARRANERLIAEAGRAGLRVADLWTHTGPPYRGRFADGLHPNALGLDGWVAALAEAVGIDGEPGRP